jgi:hypothetical protein
LVETLPSHQIRQLGGYAEHLLTHRIRAERPAQIGGDISREVGDGGEPPIATAEPLVGTAQGAGHLPHSVDLSLAKECGTFEMTLLIGATRRPCTFASSLQRRMRSTVSS